MSRGEVLAKAVMEKALAASADGRGDRGGGGDDDGDLSTFW